MIRVPKEDSALRTPHSALEDSAMEDSAIRNPQSAFKSLVVIGSSAGGINALKEVLSGLPAGLPAAVIIVQHLVRTRKTQLHLFLDRISPLRVMMAESDAILESGTGYLAEPGKHLGIENGNLVLSCSKKVHYVRPSVDTLFISAARAYGSRVIGVIMSGSGQDGATGCLEIKAKGGVIIAQDEKTSQWFGMPGAAINTGIVDYVLNIKEIAGKIVELVKTKEIED